MRQFYQIDAYESPQAHYQLLPFRFLRMDPDQRELLVTDAGEYEIVPAGTTSDLVRGRVGRHSALYKTLKAKQFIFDEDSASMLDVLATKYRTKKSFLSGFAKLHIFVVTLRCDHSCHYCQVSRQTEDRTTYDMSTETAERALALMMRSPGKDLTLEFQGGESLLAFPVIKWIVGRAEELASIHSKNLTIVIRTNLAFADDAVLRYCRDEDIKLSTSLDGPSFLHNANRPRPENNSYELTIAGIKRARDIIGPENVGPLPPLKHTRTRHQNILASTHQKPPQFVPPMLTGQTPPTTSARSAGFGITSSSVPPSRFSSTSLARNESPPSEQSPPAATPRTPGRKQYVCLPAAFPRRKALPRRSVRPNQ
jgi:hypothetical protein